MKNLVKITIAGILLLIILQVMAANQLANQGLLLTNLEKKEQALKEETGFLERKIASSSSLTQISLKVESLGFVKKAKLYSFAPFNVSLAR